MNFQDNLYHIISSVRTEEEYGYSIRMNAGHVIYKAHFPGEPITPGVCLLQIGVELLSLVLGKKLEPVNVKNVKFLNMLTPGESPVDVRIRNVVRDGEEVRAQIEFTASVGTISKISIICRTAA